MTALLGILISTVGERIRYVPSIFLSERKDVRYIVSWQNFDQPLPPELKDSFDRGDVELCTISGKGLSRNRNNALRHCRTQFALIADDDVSYTEQQIDNLLSLIADHPQIDVFCCRVEGQDGEFLKSYFPTPFNYRNRPAGSYFSSIEIVLRMSGKIPSFDEHFGLGAGFLSCGEEEVFLHDADAAGLSICYFPLTICRTNDIHTTGSRFAKDVRVRRSKGAVLYILHGYWGAVARCLKFYFLHRPLLHPSALRDMTDGIRYIEKARRC